MAPRGRLVIAVLLTLGLPLAALVIAQIAVDGADRPAASPAAHVVATTPTPAPTATPATAASNALPTQPSPGTATPGLAASFGTQATAPTPALPGAPGATAVGTGDIFTTAITLRSGRVYDLHTTASPGQARPLVVLLHAYAHDAAIMRDMSGATPFADEHGFALAYGHAVDGAWNSGTCCVSANSANGVNGADDLAYLRELVADASRRTPVDPTRVYVWGYSNGGMMAARAVCEAPDVFAAAGVVAGQLLVPCDSAPIRMMHIHGTDDQTVPWRGGWSDYVHVWFPDARTESSRVTSSSEVVGVPWPGGHSWPWWATGLLWDFSSQQARHDVRALTGTP